MRTGARPDLNTEDAKVIARAGDELSKLGPICNPKVTITDYQTLPEGKTVLHHSWSGDLLGAAFYYMPKGVSPDVLSFWAPDQNGVVQNDFFCIGRGAKNPALAHQFINFMLDEKNAYTNFVNFNGYVPPQNGIDADTLIRRGLIPKTLEPAVVRPDQFAANQELLAAQRRPASGSGTRPGRSSRPVDAVAVDLALARAAGRRLAVALLPRRVLRGHCGRVRQPEHAHRSPSRSGTRWTGTSATSSRCSRTSGTASSS